MKKHIRLLLLAFLFAPILYLFDACRKDPQFKDSSARLEFSADTILFDTVFTTVGSATQWLQVYNPYKKRLVISNIHLGNRSNSFFKINVNGISGKEFKDVEIAGGDSIFIFVEVTVDPRNSNNPMIATDSILFETNGNEQHVQLVAWGQDAHFHTPLKGTYVSLPVYCDEVWTKDKPHVIYGYFVIPPECSLRVTEGTKIHIHGNSGIVVFNDASIKISGTKDEPVVIQGDRLDASYVDRPGQWDRIWLSAGSYGNEIDYAIIKNGNVGLQVDTFGISGPTLKLSNTKILNMAGAGLFAQGAKVEAYNSVIGNCGLHAVWLSIGGEYSFKHCTFANFWSGDTRETPMLLMDNFYEDQNKNIVTRDLNKAYFGNCVIYGNLKKEIAFNYKSTALYNYTFDHCIVKSDSAFKAQMTAFPDKFLEVIQDTVIFFDLGTNNYALDASSQGNDKGDPLITSSNAILSKDITGTVRSTSTPDMGAYEK